jgi:hypothetical protein
MQSDDGWHKTKMKGANEMSEMRQIFKTLRELSVKHPEDFAVAVFQRGNYTCVALGYHRNGVHLEGVGFAKRDPTRYHFFNEAADEWQRQQDALDAKRGIAIATGRALRDLAEQMARNTEPDENDVPF